MASVNPRIPAGKVPMRINQLEVNFKRRSRPVSAPAAPNSGASHVTGFVSGAPGRLEFALQDKSCAQGKSGNIDAMPGCAFRREPFAAGGA